MQIERWQYYNHAAIPTTAPHEEPNIDPINDGTIWKISGGTPLLARWTTEFDCGYETNWWYVIKDTPFVISELKAKRRYEINKGIKNFEVKEIDPTEYKEALLEVQVAAFSAYPEKYRPTVEREAFFKEIDSWQDYIVIGAFFREGGALCGYALLSCDSEDFVDFKVLKTNPAFEGYAVNAALVEGVMRHFEAFLEKGGYLCDGARSINHETAFQDYLEKYFGFRKAYCSLRVAYKPGIRWIINLLFVFRKLLKKLDGIGIFHLFNSVLQMEEICRENKKAQIGNAEKHTV